MLNDPILAAKAKRGEVVAAMTAMLDTADTEDRDLTGGETRKYERMKAQITELDSEIQRAEERERREIEAHIRPGGNVIAPPTVAGKVLNAFGTGRDASERAYRVGQWVRAQLLGNERAQRWCEDRGLRIEAAHSEANIAKGGALVPDEMSSAIIRLVEDYGVARKEARVVTMGSDTLLIPRRTGGLTSYFVGENTEGTESDSAWDNVTMSAKKLMVLTRMSSEVSEDAIVDLAVALTEEIALSFAEKEDDCLFNGDGTSTYGGMTGILQKIVDGNHTAGAVDVATATHNLFSEIDATDLSTLKAACPGYALRNAKWYTSRVGWSLVFERLLQAGGGNTMVTLADGAPVYRYLGHPVVISEKMPNGAATDYDGDAMIVFGDMAKAVTLGTRREIRVALSGERWFELDQIGVKGTERFDINVHDLGDNTTAGPIVALVGSSS